MTASKHRMTLRDLDAEMHGQFGYPLLLAYRCQEIQIEPLGKFWDTLRSYLRTDDGFYIITECTALNVPGETMVDVPIEDTPYE